MLTWEPQGERAGDGAGGRKSGAAGWVLLSAPAAALLVSEGERLAASLVVFLAALVFCMDLMERRWSSRDGGAGRPPEH